MATGPFMVAGSASWCLHGPAFCQGQGNAQPQDARKTNASSLELSAELDFIQCGHAGT